MTISSKPTEQTFGLDPLVQHLIHQTNKHVAFGSGEFGSNILLNKTSSCYKNKKPPCLQPTKHFQSKTNKQISIQIYVNKIHTKSIVYYFKSDQPQKRVTLIPLLSQNLPMIDTSKKVLLHMPLRYSKMLDGLVVLIFF